MFSRRVDNDQPAGYNLHMTELTITEFARMGGRATVEKYGNEHMRELSKKGVAARRKKKKTSKK